jgi:hypothetical protein
MLRSTSARALAPERHRNRPSATRVRALVLQTRLGIGATGQAERLVAEMTREERGTGPVRPVVVLLPMAGDDRDAAMRVLASGAGGSMPVDHPVGQGYVMAAAGGDAPAGTTAADVAPARVLGRAQPGGMPEREHPVSGCRSGYRAQGTAAVVWGTARGMGGSLARAVVARGASAVLGGSPGDEGAKLATGLGDAATSACCGCPGGIASRSWEGDRPWNT